MSVRIESVSIGRCYSRFSEIRRVTALSKASVTYVTTNRTDGGGTSTTGPQSRSLAIFAQEVDREVPCPADLV
jgi:hypothetical protein